MVMTETTILTGLAVGESVRWHNGRVWVANWGAGEIVSARPDGSDRVAISVPDTIPISFDWLPDDSLLVVAGTEARILRYGADGSYTVHADLSSLSEHSWNEIVVDGRGNVYTNSIDFDLMGGGPPSPGIIALVPPHGAARIVADGVEFPNGMVVTPDNRTLIVAESFAARLTAFDIDDDGGLSNRRVFAERPGDGITLDATGAIWCGAFGDTAPYVARIAEGGEILDRIDLELAPFSCMLGGPGGDTLFVAAADWQGFDRMGELFSSQTGVLLAFPAPAKAAGHP
jgi:sugar lactone lactonase YvrE